MSVRHWPSLLLQLLASGALVGALGAADPSVQPDEAANGFSSLTERLNFKVNYRVLSLANGLPIALVNVRESYHSSLATGLVKLMVHRRSSSQPSQVARNERKFYYDSESRRLVEFQRNRPAELAADELLGDEFYLFENGGSNCYSKRQDDNASHLRWQVQSVRLLPAGSTLDSLLLLPLTIADDTGPKLELNHFMRPECLVAIEKKLPYLNGLTRLLLLIECRRNEFKLAPDQDKHRAAGLTRGLASRLYEAKNLGPIAKGLASSAHVQHINMSLSVGEDCEAQQGGSAHVLPSNCVPLSMALESVHAGEEFLLLVDVFQFETLAPGEHVSESAAADGRSIYLLPLNQLKLSHLLATARGREQEQSGQQHDQFSFRASLTVSRAYDSAARRVNSGEPIELVTVYDGRANTMAVQMEFVDKSRSAGVLDGWMRDVVRTMYDGQSGTKYHFMRENFQYNNRDELNVERELSAEWANAWRSCATDKLNRFEADMLAREGGGEMFQLAGASFMGTALVRGLLCHVFERRLASLPAFLALTSDDYFHLDSLSTSEIFLQTYVAVGQLDEQHFLSGQMARTAIAADGKIMRLDVRVVSRSSEDMMSFRLELSAFDWSTHLVNDVPELANAAQECLMNNLDARHLDMELWLDLVQAERWGSLAGEQLEALKLIRWDSSSREQAVARLLADALDFSPAQQVDLEAQFGQVDWRRPLESQAQLGVKLRLFEQSDELLEVQFIGYAQDLSSPLGGPVDERVVELRVGARSFSYDECKWRAAHTLSLPDDNLRLFMFCPLTSVCLLGDSQWLPARERHSIYIDGLLRYPHPATARAGEPRTGRLDERCVLSSVQLKERHQAELAQVGRLNRRRPQFDLGEQRQLDWLMAQQADGFEAIRQRQFELRVELAPVAARLGEGNVSRPERRLVSLPFKAARVKLSNRIFSRSSTQASDQAQDEGASLLTKPLAGLGYLEAAGEEAPELLTVSRLAQCSRACLQLHDCRSFSACHLANAKLGCRFSSLAWSDGREMEQLLALAQAKQSSRLAASLELELRTPHGEALESTQAKLVRVQFKRSQLCSLHARPQVELFEWRRDELEAAVPATSSLIFAQSAEQCARFCQERGRLVRLLDQAKAGSNATLAGGQMLTSQRELACTHFHFASADSYCKLLPAQNHWALLGLEHLLSAGLASQTPGPLEAPPSHRTVRRWREWFERSAQRKTWPSSVATRRAELFELDFEQIFQAHRGLRLELDEGRKLPDPAQAYQNRLQLDGAGQSVSDCARRCINTLGCRSFDVRLAAAAADHFARSSSAELCVLNAVSFAELADSSRRPVFRAAASGQEAGQAGLWWHYEPSELALDMLLEPRETSDSEQASESLEVEDTMRAFLRPPGSQKIAVT